MSGKAKVVKSFHPLQGHGVEFRVVVQVSLHVLMQGGIEVEVVVAPLMVQVSLHILMRGGIVVEVVVAPPGGAGHTGLHLLFPHSC